MTNAQTTVKTPVHGRTTMTSVITVLLFSGVSLFIAQPSRAQQSAVQAQLEYQDPASVSVKGMLGHAIAISKSGRLTQLPSWNNGELITMFGEEVKNNHHRTDWRGEHGGKWLYAASMAARQGDDPELKALLIKTADFLIAQQEKDGYLGTYSPRVRLTSAEASHGRSWDAWNLSCMALGLIEVHHLLKEPKYLDAAKKIGELFIATFGKGQRDITEYGTRYGISATIILDPVVELFKVTRDNRYLELAETVMERMEARPGANIVSVAASGNDLERVGDGKAYQLLWNLTAIAKLYEVTGNPEYLKAVTQGWKNVTQHHLTLAGGPWGGVGKHLECFNRRYFWNPYGFIETCSTMSWIQLNKVMLRLTGDAKYAEEIERAAYNALLGAQYPNGVDWAYHSFSNGRRHIAHFDDCCPSSGVLALQELPTLLYAVKGKGIVCNLFTAGAATVTLNNGNRVSIQQETGYPFEGDISLTVSPQKKEAFPLHIRIPAWADHADIRVNGQAIDTTGFRAGAYFTLNRTWRKGDRVDIVFPMALRLHRKAERTDSPQGGPDLYRVNWFALTRGPLVFAAHGLINNNREQVVPLSDEDPEKIFTPVEPPEGFDGPAYELTYGKGDRVLFLPYYEAGGREANTWRLTWVQSGIAE